MTSYLKNTLPALCLLLAACTEPASTAQQTPTTPSAIRSTAGFAPTNRPDLAQATFAGGCFWCTEEVFEELTGVEAVVSGYSCVL